MLKPHKKASLFLLVFMAFLWAGIFLEAETISTYKIADPVGDWGFPSPYGMYPRGPGYVRMSLIFDTLLWKDKQGLVPALAKSWEYIEKEKAYLFHLGHDITWHDGKALTAGDVLFTFQYLKKHPWPWFTPDMIDAMESKDKYTVKIYLKDHYTPFITQAACTVPILPRHIWEKIDNPGNCRDKKVLIGSGPFKLMDYNKASGSYLYVANNHYYGGLPLVNRLIFLKAPIGTAPILLKKKMINACALPVDWVEEFKAKDFPVITQPCAWVAKLVINHKHPLLAGTRMRRVLAYALDLEKIVKIINRGHAIPGNPGLLPPDQSPWHNTKCSKYPYQPGRVSAILKELGYQKNHKGKYCKAGVPLEFELLVNSSSRPEFSRLAEFIKLELEKLGIGIILRNQEAKTLDTLVLNWKFQLALQGHGGLGSDPAILFKAIIHNGFNSARYFENNELIRLLELQFRQRDQEERCKTVHRIQQIYASEVPAIPLYYPKNYWTHDGSIELYYTPGGIAMGIPLAINKSVFIKSPTP